MASDSAHPRARSESRRRLTLSELRGMAESPGQNKLLSHSAVELLTLSSAHASSGPSPVAELSLFAPLILFFSNSGGGELAFELDMFDGGRRGVTRGDDNGDTRYSSPPRELALLPERWCVDRNSSTARKDGV